MVTGIQSWKKKENHVTVTYANSVHFPRIRSCLKEGNPSERTDGWIQSAVGSGE
jgi:hypothetical protein